MKKRSIITIAIVLVIIAAGVWVYSYLSSLRDVTFTVKQADIAVDIYKKDEKENPPLKTLTVTQATLSLQEGEYSYVARGDKVSDQEQFFQVTADGQEVVIDPDYSETYLAEVLQSEKEVLHGIISDKYPDLIQDYTILDGKLLKKGEWYGTILRLSNVDPRDNTDLYRVLLKKTDDSWQIVRYPELILTTKNYPDIPVDVLKAVNNLLAA